jgi:23S rRNA (adenine2503-C2)-methyltransferase
MTAVVSLPHPGAEAPRRQPSLLGLGRADLSAALATFGEPPFRARQLWHWLYARGASDFAAMTSLAKSLRAALAEHWRIGRPAVAEHQRSADGTQKWLLTFDDGKQAEMVFIPEPDRGTLCVSSQVGCTLTCTFCHTGTQRLVRNLTAGEIVGQVLLARDALGDWPSRSDGRIITNIVFMGMGEPLFNYDNVAAAIAILTDAEGIAISRRRITLSTSGVVPLIGRVGAELGVKLAVSLHAPTDDLRNQLVPINRKYPLAALMAACRTYPGLDNANRITFEYVMLAGVNDSLADAGALARLVAGIPCKFNLIPFNPWPGAPYRCSPPEVIARFADALAAKGYTAPIRQPRGDDILAACGQLRSASERERLSRLKARLAAGIIDDDHHPLPASGAAQRQGEI